MEHRTQTADVLKGVAVLLMIQVHIVELFATDSIYNSNFGEILLFLGGPPVAPLFMIVFGYFIFSSNKSTTQLILRGLSIFVLGMILNLALNFNLILSVYQEKIQVDIWSYIFGVDILQFAGLSLIIIALLKNIYQKHIVFVFAMILLSVFLGNLCSKHIPENNTLQFLSAYFYGSTDWSYFPLFPWLAYPLCGIVLFQLQQRTCVSLFLHTKMKLVTGSIYLIVFALTIKYAVSICSDLLSYYHHGILFFIWTIAFCLFYSLFAHELNQRFGETWLFKYIKWLGKNVTLLYVIQWIIIGNIATEIYKTVSDSLYLACWFLAIVSISSGLTYLILKVKVRQYENK